MDILPPIKTPEAAAERAAELYHKYNAAVAAAEDTRVAADGHPDSYDGYAADDSTQDELFNLYNRAKLAKLNLEEISAANVEFFKEHGGLLVEAALAEARTAGITINY